MVFADPSDRAYHYWFIFARRQGLFVAAELLQEKPALFVGSRQITTSLLVASIAC
jgi:hypothetical protein